MNDKLMDLIKIIGGMFSIIIYYDGSGYVLDVFSHEVAEFRDAFDPKEIERVTVKVKEHLDRIYNEYASVNNEL